ncbi:MAG: substrate-binding domain-containing protein [Clostridia bacterium]|nr:substrate-binding domain-containing protein [Clostridia bacterium]
MLPACQKEGEVKLLSLEGVECTTENIESGEYALQRPFNLVYRSDSELGGAAQTFMSWLQTDEAIEIITEEGYVITREGIEFDESEGVFEGSFSLSGSTSVYPLMMVLTEEYMIKFPGVSITVQAGGSGVGLSDAEAGIVDIGMISKELDEESYPTLDCFNLCTDGIALIVNENCEVDDVTIEEVKELYVNLTPIQDTIVAAIGRDSGSGTRSAFDELMGIEISYASDVDELADTGNVLSLIRKNSKGDTMGYVSAGSV